MAATEEKINLYLQNTTSSFNIVASTIIPINLYLDKNTYAFDVNVLNIFRGQLLSYYDPQILSDLDSLTIGSM